MVCDNNLEKYTYVQKVDNYQGREISSSGKTLFLLTRTVMSIEGMKIEGYHSQHMLLAFYFLYTHKFQFIDFLLEISELTTCQKKSGLEHT